MRDRHRVLRRMEQPYRSAVENHVHRATTMRPWILVNAGWYKVTFTGLIGRDAVADYVAAFDVALHPAVRL